MRKSRTRGSMYVCSSTFLKPLIGFLFFVHLRLLNKLLGLKRKSASNFKEAIMAS